MEHNDTSIRRIFRTWWPLAASWLLMGVEMPALNAIMARLPHAEINLAAYGGIVFPVSLVIEAPIVMLLSASTALAKDWPSYLQIRRFMMVTCFSLTLLHILIAFTPLYDIVVTHILGSPAEIIEPGRIGLQLMTPWTWSIGFRRFQQGVMIRNGQSRAVGIGTLVRLIADALVLGVGFSIGTIGGTAVAAAAQATGVLAEAVYAGFRVRPILRDLKILPTGEALTWNGFFKFYIPLVLTQFLQFIWNPIGSAAISRMPRAVESLAVWQVLSSLLFILRSSGFALNEVVIALLGEPHSSTNLRRFTGYLASALGFLTLLVCITPAANFWFSSLSALRPELTELGMSAFWLGIAIPTLTVLQSWYQGAILYSRHTRPIPVSVMIFLSVAVIILGSGAVYGKVAGVYVGTVAFTLAVLAQSFWLWYRSRNIMSAVNQRDTAVPL